MLALLLLSEGFRRMGLRKNCVKKIERRDVKIDEGDPSKQKTIDIPEINEIDVTEVWKYF